LQCGGSLENARRESVAGKLAALWLPPIVCGLFLFGANVFLHGHDRDEATFLKNELQKIETEHTAGVARLDAEWGRKEAEQEAMHRGALGDPGLTSGKQAAERRAEEWKRRQNHDPAYAASILEQTLVDVEKLGKDPSLTAETALKRVAEMVAPYGSRVEVTPTGDRFVVRIAFRMSAIRPNEAGSGTRHTSSTELRKEIEEISAYLIRDLFDYCGTRGIERLSVSCNRAITETSVEGQDRLIMRSLYRASIDAAAAAQVPRWRSLSLSQIAALTKVERDIISQVTLQKGGAAPAPLDPNQPLEF